LLNFFVSWLIGPRSSASASASASAALLASRKRCVKENRDLTVSGVIVVAPGEADGPVTDDQKVVLDALHLSKIELADRVLIVNPGGYVGESTKREIAYATALGKPVEFTHPS
jgi:predicted phosphodiesterase